MKRECRTGDRDVGESFHSENVTTAIMTNDCMDQGYEVSFLEYEESQQGGVVQWA